MLQLITSDFQLRRLGRVVISVLITVVVLPGLDLAYTPAMVYLLLITPVTGAAIYGAFFAIAGGLQFFLINGPEFTAAFVYGGSYAGQLPGSVLITPLRVLFTFVFPATVTAYLPALLIMGLPGPEFLPAWLGWFAPLFAAWVWLLAWLAWRAGMRRFTGAGG
jgi:ABC-2 type transport system permease protein